MLTRALGILIPAALVSLSACSRKDTSGCAQNTDCPDGHVCLSDKCEQVCAVDSDCAAGRYCDGEICIAGRRESPVISGITGNGDPGACLAATGKNCLGTAIVVTGSNLGGSSFLLASSLPNGPQYTLTPALGGRVQDAVVDLVPTTGGSSLVFGQYLLTATNAAGTAQAEVEMLKGDKGDKGDQGDKGDPGSIASLTGNDIVFAINDTETTLQILAARVAGGGGGGTRYTYDNSTNVTTTPITHDRMVVKLNGLNSGPATLDLKGTRLKDLCGDEDGCTIRLGMTNWHVAPYVIAAPLMGAPCHFSLDANNNWAVSPTCTLSAGWGTDGGNDYDVPNPPHNRSWVVLHNFACYLSEAAPTGATAGLEDDTAVGFYLIASHPSWAGSYFPTKPTLSTDPPGWDPTDTQRACILIVDD